MDKYIGRLLDNRYEILEIIGTGGMAVVYKARCHRLNRLVAIKILKDDYLEDEDFRRRFHSESQAVAMLSHPNIVSVYDVSTSIMADYIVMELIEGISLKQYMEKKGVLNWKETLHFGIQIAKALEHAHGRGIVHRDIKPHNVMVLKNGSVKVTDFGIARMMSKGNTLTKEALGSVHYISPEQAKGGRVDNRSDIYSLGVVMYEMMTGRPPYDGDSPVSVAIQHINGGAQMPSTLNPNIPGGLEQIIMKAMAHEPEARYTTASQMLADMDEFRKDPTMLFDYNTPPLDVVTRLPHPVPEEVKPVIPPRVTEGNVPPRRPRPDTGRTPQRKTRAQTAQRRAKEEKRSNVATIAIIVCALVAVFAVVAFLITLLSGAIGKNEKLVAVPTLEGELEATMPDYKEFEIVTNEVYDEKIPAGTIIEQKPDAGTEVVEGTKIVITVSKGPAPQTIYMSNLVDMTEDKARAYLNSLGLNLQFRVEEEYNDTIAEGSVTRTDPVKDKELTTGQTVILYISKGKEIQTGRMPNLVDKREKDAEITLDNTKLDLQISREEVFDSEIEEGRVVRTDPEMGEELKTGQNVRLYISKGPEKENMPNVVGMDVEKAVNIITSAGFKTPKIEYVESNESKDTVVNQSVPKNTMVDIKTEILLEISAGPKETTEPTQPTVVKDVIIDLRGSTESAPCRVTVLRNGSTVYSGTVAQGTASITIPNQEGSGYVYYDVIINEADGWIEKVQF